MKFCWRDCLHRMNMARIIETEKKSKKMFHIFLDLTHLANNSFSVIYLCITANYVK